MRIEAVRRASLGMARRLERPSSSVLAPAALFALVLWIGGCVDGRRLGPADATGDGASAGDGTWRPTDSRTAPTDGSGSTRDALDGSSSGDSSSPRDATGGTDSSPSLDSRTSSETSGDGGQQTSYHWRTGAWGSCSKKCGGGTRMRTVECVTSGGRVVPDRKCTSSKPASQQSCNTSSCFFDVKRTFTHSGSRDGNHDITYPAKSPSGPYSPAASSNNYRVEGAIFRASKVKKSGFRPIYNCRNNLDTFLSLQSGCEGKTSVNNAPVGYLSKTSTSSHSKAVYRCYIPADQTSLSTGDHFVSTASDCEQSFANREDVLGYF